MNDAAPRINNTVSIKEPLLKKFFFHCHGIFSVLVISINTLFWFTPLMLASFLKLMIPIKFWHKFMTGIVTAIARTWISINNFNIAWSKNIKWEMSGIDKLKKDDWYLVISNHQTWIDIVVLQKVFNGKIPFLKFFLKKELIWVPLLGVAWWALEYPFMKRFTKEYLEQNPHMKGKDLEITHKACEKYKTSPVSIMNFVEGTRFTEEKHKRQQSPFKHLLRPKAGGISFVLSAMGRQLHTILDVTITYPEGNTSFWDFLCGKIHAINIDVKEIPITDEILGDYENDPVFKEFFQKWLNDLWLQKDKFLQSELS